MDSVRGIRPGVLFVQGSCATIHPLNGDDDDGGTQPISSFESEAAMSDPKIGCTVVNQRREFAERQKKSDNERPGLRLRKKGSAVNVTVRQDAGVSKAAGSGSGSVSTRPEVPFWQKLPRMPLKALSWNQRSKNCHQA